MNLPARLKKAAVWRSGGFGVSAVYFVLYAAGGMWSPLLNVYLQQMGLSGAQIGAIASYAALLSARP